MTTQAGLHIARPTDQPERADGSGDRQPAPALVRCAPESPETAPRDADLRGALLGQLDALYRFILVRVGFDESLADDLLQQTAEAVLRAEPGGLDEVETFEGWLRGVARNLVRRHWRESARRDSLPRPDPVAGHRVLAALESGCPAEALADRELRLALLWAIASLPAADQWLLFAVYRHGRSHAEIAQEQGCSAKGIEARLYRMRARLREALAASGEEP